MVSSSRTSSLSFLLFFIQIFPFIVQAVVPPSATFKYVNEGDFGDYIVEYDANYRVLDIFSFPYQLCFYNATPNEYYLGLRVGTVRSTSLMRWVWEFNRGKPVRENATFSLGTDGNLVLADADGRIAWQSKTANKGVTAFKLLSDGNMVLHDAQGTFIWQSFDYPTDTLLNGQQFQIGGPNKLVSRASPQQNVNGPYSLVFETRRLAMYYKSKNSPKPQLYFDSTSWISLGNGSLEWVRMDTSIVDTNIYDLNLHYKVLNVESGGSLFLGRTRYNNSISYLRLGIDGTLKAFVFDQEVDISAWEEKFDLFSRETIGAGTCQLPERCGKFGLCDKGQCVACPSPTGLLGWSEKCKPPKVSSCVAKDVKYYKLVGVDHFITKYTKGEGPMKESDCSKKCTLDCKCAGYFYQQDKSMCWIAYDLMTLTKVADKKHLGYIKF